MYSEKGLVIFESNVWKNPVGYVDVLILLCASLWSLITKLEKVPFSFNAVVKVLAPSATPLTIAETVPDNPLNAFPAIDVSIVPLVYLLAVDVCKLAPATNGFDALLSANPCANLGLNPCAVSVSVIVLLDKPDGAEGIAFTWNVKLAVSVWAVISGVPDTVKSNW